ncbi:hypothetical protein WA158_004365 [Blastocystis sp. Blastoise]
MICRYSAAFKDVPDKVERAALVYTNAKTDYGKHGFTYMEVANYFDVTLSSLYRAVKALKDKRPISHPGRPRYLTNDVEVSLCDDWRIQALKNDPVSVFDAINDVTSVINYKHENKTRKQSPVSRKYISNILKRNDFKLKNVKVVTRTTDYPPREDVKVFLDELHELYKSNYYRDCLIFNMDESWLHYNKDKSSIKVITPPNSKILRLSSEKEEHMTVICCVSKAGFFVPLEMLVPFKSISISDVLSKDLGSLIIKESAKGWMNKNEFKNWIDNVFLPYVNYNRRFSKTERALLIVDGHTSRFDSTSLMELRKNNIDCILLPPNSTSILQPLDHVVFSSFKTELCKKLKSGNKCDFIKAGYESLMNALSYNNIKQGWAQTNLFGKPEDVLELFESKKIQNKKRKKVNIISNVLTCEENIRRLSGISLDVTVVETNNDF